MITMIIFYNHDNNDNDWIYHIYNIHDLLILNMFVIKIRNTSVQAQYKSRFIFAVGVCFTGLPEFQPTVANSKKI